MTPRFAMPSMRALQAAALLVTCFLLRSVYVSLFACDLPQWDQWDAEGDFLLRAWMNGTWKVAELFSSHNEHRIAFTRLISLAIFKLNSGQWDNLVEAYVTAGIFSTALVTLWALLNRNGRSTTVRLVSAILVVAIAALPFSWENALVGFQNQFYLMAIGAFAMLAIAAYKQPSTRMIAYLTIVGIATLFTMASGVAAAVACIGVIVLRAWREPLSRGFILGSVCAMVLVTMTGVLLVPVLPGHEANTSVGLAEHVRAFTIVLMWPFEPSMAVARSTVSIVGIVLILWLPSLLWIVRFVRQRAATSQELFAIGVCIWVLVQAAAIAHSRGHGLGALASRYMDIPAIGIVANVWFALSTTVLKRREALGLSAASLALCVAGATAGLYLRTPADWRLAIDRQQHTDLQTVNVRNYMASGDPADLDKPFFTIPYPDAKRLRSLLDDPVVRHMLPISVRTPLWAPMPLGGFSRDNLPPSVNDGIDRTAIGSYSPSEHESFEASMTSPGLRSAFPRLAIPTVGGRIGRNGLAIVIVEGSHSTPIEQRRQSGLTWTFAFVAAPKQEFHVDAHDRSANSWMGLGAPVESGVLSEWAHRFQDVSVRRLSRMGVTPP